MTNKERAKLLFDRHLKFIIEWGGTDDFTNCSDMSIEGMAELLKIMRLTDKKEINKRLDKLVGGEYDKEED